MATEPDYYIVTFQTGGRLSPWRWEIRRHSSPMGVKLGAGGYPNQTVAETAGKEALTRLMQDMARDERARRK
jgi:hypothetical protein